MIAISLSEKFAVKTFITCIKVIDTTENSNKTNKLRNINTIAVEQGTSPSRERKIHNIKVKVIPFIIKFSLSKTIRYR